MPEVAHSRNRTGHKRRRWLLVAAIPVALLIVAAAVVASMAEELIERRLRVVTIDLLSSRFDSEVELGEVNVQLRSNVRVRYERLALRHHGRRDIPPVLSIRAFTLEGRPFDLWNRRVDLVHVEGLEIVVPPRRGDDLPAVANTDRITPPTQDTPTDGRPDVLIRQLISEDARLSIMPRREGKRTREFYFHYLQFDNLQFAKPASFQASLTNPIPKGHIDAIGTFGPWDGDEPSLTPVGGTFTFDADLGTIKGIAGRLDSEGSFSGPLEQIRTMGRTETPDFRITALEGHALPLSTTFDALVDGTNGDVILTEVRAKIGESTFLNSGAIIDIKDVPGRRITLNVKAEQARLEDVLRLSMKGSKPAMTGRVSTQARLDIPPSAADLDVIERMALDGVFHIDQARFTSDQVQGKIDAFARRGQGRPKDDNVDDVMSDMKGRVRVAKSRMRLTDLTFVVQGATVAMDGTYNLRNEGLDFTGVVLLRARASQTMTGFTSLLLKPFDSLLRKQGAGTRLAIKVTGTRDHPRFDVDWGRTIRGR